MEKVNTGNVQKLADKSSKLAHEVVAKMEQLGVTSLDCVKIEYRQSHTHGKQTYLYIESDHNENGDLLCTTIRDSDDFFYDYGDFSLPTAYPNLDQVKRFLNSIDDINQAIIDANMEIEALLDKKVSIS